MKMKVIGKQEKTHAVAASPTSMVCLVYFITALATAIACFTLLRSPTAPTS